MGFRYAYDQFKALQESRARSALLVEEVKALPWQRIEQSELVDGAPVAVIATQDRYGIPLRAGLCLESGLVYLMDRLTAEGYATFYKEFYRPLVARFWQRPFDLQRFRQQGLQYGRGVFESIAPRLPDTASVPTLLDVGGSTGHVAQIFAERAGYHATVLDPSPDELQVAADSGLDVAEGFLETYEAQGRQFDLVLLCQTIDHLLDLRGALERLYDLVKPRGLLFVDIIDFDEACHLSMSVEGALHLDHCYYLSQETALWLFSSMGWEVLQVDVAMQWVSQVGYLLRRGVPPVDPVPPPTNVLDRLRAFQRLQTTQAIAQRQTFGVMGARKRVHRLRRSLRKKLGGS